MALNVVVHGMTIIMASLSIEMMLLRRVFSKFLLQTFLKLGLAHGFKSAKVNVDILYKADGFYMYCDLIFGISQLPFNLHTLITLLKF